MNDTRRCGDAGGVNAQGEPCEQSMNLNDQNGLCLWHDPTRKEQAQDARALGGRNRSLTRTVTIADAPSPPKTLEDAVEFSSWLAHAVLVGAIDARTAEASSKAISVFRSVAEKRDLERKVRLLESKVAKYERLRAG